MSAATAVEATTASAAMEAAASAAGEATATAEASTATEVTSATAGSAEAAATSEAAAIADARLATAEAATVSAKAGLVSTKAAAVYVAAEILAAVEGLAVSVKALGSTAEVATVLTEVTVVVEGLTASIEVLVAVETLPTAIEAAAVYRNARPVEIVHRRAAAEIGEPCGWIALETCTARMDGNSAIGLVIERSAEARPEVAIGAVVPEAATIPVTAIEAGAEVTEAVINAAVVANRGSPVTGMPEVSAVTPAPPAWGPKGTHIRRKHPGAVDPVITVRAVGPVTGSPDITITRGYRLRIHRNRGWGNAHRDKHGSVRRRGNNGCSEGKGRT